jgi:hypothetical protein
MWPVRRCLSEVVALWMLALSPAAWLLFAGVFVLRARLALGRWPKPYEPDPKDLGFGLHYVAVQLGIPIMWAFSLSCVAIAALGFRRLAADGARPLGALVVLGVCLIGLLFLAQLDPGQIFTWLGD